jgi:hypothetical protein
MPRRLIGPLVMAALVCWAIAARGQATLPEGSGKDVVETKCSVCHGLQQITRAGYSHDGWLNVVAMMVNVGAKLSPAEASTVVDYLAKNFPEKAGPAPVIVPGSAHVTIQEWVVPTPGSRPHDPLAMPDGSIWYSGQMANVLGRLDPTTGVIREYHLPEGSGPHGLMPDTAGNIWYTANFKAYIGKFDPKTGKVREYPMPTRRRAIHTPSFSTRRACCGSPCRAVISSGTWTRRRVTSNSSSYRRRDRCRTGWSSTRKASHFSTSSAGIGSRGSIPRRWNSTNTRCPIQLRGRAASRRRATT